MFVYRQWKKLLLVVLLNFVIILFLYHSVFSLEFQGDEWQYAWFAKVYYGSVFSPESLKGLRTSLGGSGLTFGLIENHFGLSSVVYYSISVALKFLTVIVFYFLAKKLTNNYIASLIASILLSVTLVGVQATQWVFNMYAYIGLIFVMLGILFGLNQPNIYEFKKWFISFLFVCAGIWYATMRTNGVILLILGWSFYKIITLKSKSSFKNLISWVIGLTVFLLIDKFLLGQLESDYSTKYIIGAGLQSIQSQIAANKFDFLLSPATNFGNVILPDFVWGAINFPKIFSFFGTSSLGFVFFPLFIIFSILSWVLMSIFNERKNKSTNIPSKLIFLLFLEFFWTALVFFVSNLGPINLSSWVTIVTTLFGGYFMILCVFFLTLKQISSNLKDLYLFAFLWFFVFFLLPLFQTGGAIFGTEHRYMVTTAPSISLFIAGLITMVFKYRNEFARILVLLLVIVIFFSHATATKNFFDHKKVVHSREVSNRLWGQLLQIVPNKPQYRDNPPTIFLTSVDNPIDQETLFESLYFGLGFRFGVYYNWRPDHFGSVYNGGDYQNLIKDVKKNPKLLEDFYAVIVQNQNLFDITKQVKQKLASDVQI